MASLVPSLFSTIPRLTLLHKSSLHFIRPLQEFQGHRKLSTSIPPFLRASFNPLSAQFSCSPKGQIIKAFGQDEELVVLGIETSCDDTAAVFTTIKMEDLLAQYGGVALKMAEEAHSQVIDQVVQEALDKAKVTEEDRSAVAVTIGPGLSLCLRVGVRKARKLAGSCALPIVGVHHMEAHALVARLVERELQFPFMALLISGGHNLLILAHDLGHYVQLGTTIDDAIGEAYNKTAKWLGLDMRKSGGPAVEELAREGDANSIIFKASYLMIVNLICIILGLNFLAYSASTRFGMIKLDAGIPICSAGSEDRRARADIAASFQVVSGGVASNQLWLSDCAMLVIELLLHNVPVKKVIQLRLVMLFDELVGLSLEPLCVMIAWTGIEHFHTGRYDPPPPACEPEDTMFDLRPRWPLGPSLTSLIHASKQQQS
ncbi:hypothetical protein Pfo_005778 [Paulownia fortunei]|nr:hypothetical protein Pfo_005778 [Paulownia fortunei]